MHSVLALSLGFLGVQVAANPFTFPKYTAGFEDPKIVPSVGGKATCVVGTIPVKASAQNTQLNYDGPANQTVLTETIVEFLQVDSTLTSQVSQGKKEVSGTYNIGAQLCFPVGKTPDAHLIQLLTHGVGFDKSYWNFFSRDLSYADNAAEKGYTTLFYDRLGVGASDHPDPIQVVQAPLEVSVAHTLVQQLREGSIASTKFEKVVGVGHSFGSGITSTVTAQYPKDFDAAVLTGFSVDTKGQQPFFAGLNLAIANQNQPLRFLNLPNGYTVSDTIISNQFGFLRAPDFDYKALLLAEATKGTFTIGELFTNSQFSGSALEFTGPIDVVDGEFDLPFCQSNCLVPTNKAAAVKAAFYPAASAGSQYYILPGAGHGINAHSNAPLAYGHIFSFLAANGF